MQKSERLRGPGHECYHCKQWIPKGQEHDCWTTTETALTKDLSEDLQEAYERLRDTAAEFGEQRIYASHSCIMFSRKVCYFFVRPKTKYLEVCIFLGRAVRAPQVRKVMPSSQTKFANLVRITHRDEVEPPFTEWLREAYDVSDQLRTRAKAAAGRKSAASVKKTRRTAKRTRRKAAASSGTR